MGSSKSKNQQVSDTGEVNSNIYVNGAETALPWDLTICLYIITVAVAAQLVLQILRRQRKAIKKDIHRSVALLSSRSEQP